MTIEPEISAAIVRNLELLRAVRLHLEEDMDPALLRAVESLGQERIASFGWTGKFGDDLSDAYLAPQEWISAAGESPDEYDLYVKLEVEEDSESTWLECFLGNTPGMALWLWSDSLGKIVPTRKRLVAEVSADHALADSMRAAGFQIDQGTGVYMPLTFSRDAMAAAFETGDFTEALQPMADALDRVHDLREPLDRLVKALRAG